MGFSLFKKKNKVSGSAVLPPVGGNGPNMNGQNINNDMPPPLEPSLPPLNEQTLPDFNQSQTMPPPVQNGNNAFANAQNNGYNPIPPNAPPVNDNQLQQLSRAPTPASNMPQPTVPQQHGIGAKPTNELDEFSQLMAQKTQNNPAGQVQNNAVRASAPDIAVAQRGHQSAKSNDDLDLPNENPGEVGLFSKSGEQKFDIDSELDDLEKTLSLDNKNEQKKGQTQEKPLVKKKETTPVKEQEPQPEDNHEKESEPEVVSSESKEETENNDVGTIVSRNGVIYIEAKRYVPALEKINQAISFSEHNQLDFNVYLRLSENETVSCEKFVGFLEKVQEKLSFVESKLS
ncbi:MAG: hypothetical protein GWP09_00580 [Nitrospiraceae bacterium]|nr:hypothetical protein [Nitrospiraceae bacterium]